MTDLDKIKLIMMVQLIIIIICLSITIPSLFRETVDYEPFNRMEFFMYPHTVNNSGILHVGNTSDMNDAYDIWIKPFWVNKTDFMRFRVNQTKSEVSLVFKIDEEFEDCFVDYIKDNIDNWFGNITLCCSKDRFEVTVVYFREGS